MKKKLIYHPLIVEQHPSDYKGYEFITLLKYIDDYYLIIVDNITDTQIIAYVLDYCQQSNVNEEELINIANDWYENKRDKYPISIEFMRTNVIDNARLLLRYFQLDYVTRIIGPIYRYDMSGPKKIKRRKRKNWAPPTIAA